MPEPEAIYLLTAWSITSNLRTAWSLGPAPAGPAGPTMDDVVNMDNVISMDTLEESGTPSISIDAVADMDRVVDMDTLQEN